MRLLRNHVDDQDAVHYGIKRLRRVLQKTPTWLGLGPDYWQLKWWSTLPDEALQELSDILLLIQETMDWPVQCQLAYIAAVFKDDGSERPIALTMSLYKLMLIFMKDDLTNWES